MAESSREVSLSNKYGLHARPASRLVGVANRFQAAITIANPAGRSVNAKSIMDVLTLAAGAGTSLKIRAEGEDAEAAVAELVQLIQSRFGEE